MKILLISYDYFRYDGRVRELIKVAKDLGDVTYITRGDGDEQPQEKQHIVYKDHGYMDFIRFCGRQAKKLGKLDLIFIDTERESFPAIWQRESVVQNMWCRTAGSFTASAAHQVSRERLAVWWKKCLPDIPMWSLQPMPSVPELW